MGDFSPSSSNLKESFIMANSNKVAGSRKGIPNRNSLTVRMALNKMGFDAVGEWIKAISQIEDAFSRAQQLERLMKYIYPQLKEIEISPTEILEMEHADIMSLKRVSTEELLGAVEVVGANDSNNTNHDAKIVTKELKDV